MTNIHIHISQSQSLKYFDYFKGLLALDYRDCGLEAGVIYMVPQVRL